MSDRDVLITGIGLVSSLGVGKDAHWDVLSGGDPRPIIDSGRFAPYTVHPLPAIDWSQQIPKRGDQRQMETWQRLGTYAAGLALDDAGLKGDADRCAAMHMIVAAAGGERDIEVDESILASGKSRNDRQVIINDKLMNELRPTLFLAQLANLLAGNISIVHKVTGSSRTFMGEEGAGVTALQYAAAEIEAGQADCTLVGGAYNAEHWDMLLTFALGGHLMTSPWVPVWQREGTNAGVAAGSGAAFLVLESRRSAEERDAHAYARIASIRSDGGPRPNHSLDETIGLVASGADGPNGPLLTFSGASGDREATGIEKNALFGSDRHTVRGISTMTGHMKEAQFPFALAIAALSVDRGVAPPPFDRSVETEHPGPADSALATIVGFHGFHGAGLVVPARKGG